MEKVVEGEKRKIPGGQDPASSFGTGQHNTTQLCLELWRKKFMRATGYLTFGCGSEYLSAHCLGAESATAVDVDENSG